ncbi:MAG: hypothetical protein M1275_03300 [Patescibacteria group bacterium]|nr:hypothetical protein [Patescibacteria group bacterium]
MSQKNQSKKIVMASPEWERLIFLAQMLKFTKLEIIIKDGVPTDVVRALPHLKLDDPEAFDRDFKNYLTSS